MRHAEGTPQHTRFDAEVRVRRDFPESDVNDIMAILNQYCALPSESVFHRLHMALLQTINGRTDLPASGP